MAKWWKRGAWMIVLVLLSAEISAAQGKAAKPQPKTCKQFVQGFYDWYMMQMKREKDGPAYEYTLKNKGDYFSVALLSALREDLRASAANADEIVGLDFDPFLNTQDPAERYVLGAADSKGDKCLAEIFETRAGKKGERPAVVAEARRKNADWIFVNFHYSTNQGPDDENLLSILNKLSAERKKNGHR